MKGRFVSALIRLLAGLATAGALLGAPAAWAATQPCTVSSTSQPSPVTFPVTKITSGPVGPTLNWTVTFLCTNGSIWSKQTDSIQIYANTSGSGAQMDPTYGLLFPTGITNLWIRLVSVAPTYPLNAVGNVKVLDIPSNEKDKSHSLSFQAQFVVLNGPLPSGSSIQPQPISSFNLIQYFYNGSTQGATGADSPPWGAGAIVLPPGINVVPLSCEIASPSLLVPLPAVTRNQLASKAATAGNTPFTVDLTGCSAGTQLSISLSGQPAVDPVTGPMDPATGVVASTGTATEVAVQLLYGTDPNSPVNIGGNSKHSFTQLSGGSHLQIAYSAQYYALKPVTKPGTVSAVLTYTLSYP